MKIKRFLSIWFDYNSHRRVTESCYSDKAGNEEASPALLMLLDALIARSGDPPMPCPCPPTHTGGEAQDKAQTFSRVPSVCTRQAVIQLIWMLYHVQFVNISPIPDFLLA